MMKSKSVKFVLLSIALSALAASPITPRIAAAEPINVNQTLVSYMWSWNLTRRGNKGRKEQLHLLEDGSATIDSTSEKFHWKMEGPRTVGIQNEKGGTAVITFDARFSTFTGHGFAGPVHPVQGERLAAVVAGASERKVKRDEPSPAVASQIPPPMSVAAPEAPPSSKIDELRQHASVMLQGVLAPLEQATGPDFRGYIGDLKEDIMDEGASKPAANGTAYGLAVQFCNTLIAVENERDALIARLNNNLPTNAAAGATTTKVHPNWIDLAREQDDAARATHNNTIETSFHKQLKVQWGLRANELRKTLDSEVAQFRTALRQGPPPK